MDILVVLAMLMSRLKLGSKKYYFDVRYVDIETSEVFRRRIRIPTRGRSATPIKDRFLGCRNVDAAASHPFENRLMTIIIKVISDRP